MMVNGCCDDYICYHGCVGDPLVMDGTSAADKVLVALRDQGHRYNCVGCLSKATGLKAMHIKPILDTLIATNRANQLGSKTSESTIAAYCWGCMAYAVTYAYVPQLRDILNPSYHFPSLKKSTSLKKVN
jgi:hypothetical protein